MQKIKNMLHHNNESTSTAAPRYDSLDKNKDGRVDAADFQGKGVSTTHHNPLDRNHDGRVNLKDLKPSAKREAPINDAKLAALDRNGDGRVDARDFQSQPIGLGNRGLDRNGDGRIDALDFQQTSTVGIANVRAEPILREVVEKEVVVHEHIHPVEKEEIQPIIHREREQLEIKQVTQQLHETAIQPTLVQRRELAAEIRAPVVERGAPIQENIVLPSVDRDATMKSTQINAPIVEETIKRTVIEEIQPVLERDVIQSTLIQERQDIYEKVVEAPHVYRETTIIQDRGISGGSLEALTAQGFNLGSYQQQGMMVGHHNPLDRNHDGRVDARDFNQSGLNNQQGMMMGRTANPLDRNNDGRVDLKDLTGKPGYNNQQSMMGPKTANPLDRNNDGKVDLKDLSSRSAQAPLRTL